MSEDKDKQPGGLYDKLAEAAAQMQNTFYEPGFIFVPDRDYDEMQLRGLNMDGISRLPRYYHPDIDKAINMVKRLKRIK